jgi:hypothetical protein
MLVKKYALAEFAALIGIPLALVGLMLTSFATRDTARQLQLVKAQSQPTFSLTLHPVKAADVFAGYNELVITLAGNAESIVANVDSVFIVGGLRGKPRRLFPYPAWDSSPPKEGQVARFEADPSAFSDLRKQRDQIILASTVTIHYVDLFGDSHKKYYQFWEGVSNVASLGYPSEVNIRQGADCVQLIDDVFTKMPDDSGHQVNFNKGISVGYVNGSYTIPHGAVWQIANKLAREVSEYQALKCLGPL